VKAGFAKQFFERNTALAGRGVGYYFATYPGRLRQSTLIAKVSLDGYTQSFP
jgi:hypothetical protein